MTSIAQELICVKHEVPVPYCPYRALNRAQKLARRFPPRGLPIGNLTSQFWANVYLNHFDHFVKRELGCSGYVRYVDDFLLFAEDKGLLWAWRRAVVERLGRLRLTIHRGAHARPVTEGIPFLGFTVFPSRRRLKRRKGVHFQRRLKGLVARYNAGEIPFARVEASFKGWINHVRYGNTVGLRKAVLRRLTGLKKGPRSERAQRCNN